MSERKIFTLTPSECVERDGLIGLVGAAFDFWRRIADDRGVDPTSIIATSERFSALPRGHRRHWCYPLALKCKLIPT